MYVKGFLNFSAASLFDKTAEVVSDEHGTRGVGAEIQV